MPHTLGSKGHAPRGETLFHRQDEIAHDWIDFALPTLAVEDAVVADIGLQVMTFEMRTQ